jgi:hypothetical protein
MSRLRLLQWRSVSRLWQPLALFWRSLRELEAKVRQHAERADRAERWLHQVSVEIEQKFFGRDDGRPAKPPPPQALFRNQRQ